MKESRSGRSCQGGKRQAAIKNDPGFAGAVLMTTTGDKSKQKQNGAKDPPNPSRTSSFARDVTAKDTGRRLRTGDRQSKPPPGVQNCLCCSGLHELSSCPELQNKALQSRLDIAKRHRLCHVCMRPGHHRGRCESQRFCPCGSDKRYHRPPHNPSRGDTAETNRGNQTREGGQPSGKTPTPGNGEQPNSTEVRSTVQYANVTEPTKKKTILLHVIPVKISSSNGKSNTTYGLIDWLTWNHVSSDIAKELDLKGRKEVVSVSTPLQQEDEKFEVVEFKLQSASGEGEVITVEERLVTEKFNISEKCLPEDIDRKSHPHLVDIEIPAVKKRKVSVLIEKDVSKAMTFLKFGSRISLIAN